MSIKNQQLRLALEILRNKGDLLKAYWQIIEINK